MFEINLLSLSFNIYHETLYNHILQLTGNWSKSVLFFFVQAENKKKNRYPDKLPYDHNRVILNALLNKSSSDYINASTVVSLFFCLPISLRGV